MLDNIKLIIEEIQRLDDAQQQPYVILLVITLIRDIAYYLIVGLIVFALGKRLIDAIQSAVREARRGHA